MRSSGRSPKSPNWCDDQAAVEAVDAGRHRGVGGEDRPGPGPLERGVEVHLLTHVLPDPLQTEEAGVALVGVEHLGRRGSGDRAVRADGADAADPEQHLLGQPVIAAAAVQPVGDLALVAAVLLDVGIQQQQRYPADLGQPDLGVQRATAERHLDPDRPVGAVQLGQRQGVRIEQRIALLLPAGGVQRLLEIALAIEQTDPDDRHADVAGRLQVVAGQDPQTAGVLRQHLGDPELRREVADALRGAGVLGGVALVPEVTGQVVGQIGLDHPQVLQELLVRRELLQSLDRDVGQQLDRIAGGRLPQLGVDGSEKILGIGVPGPAQIAGELAQRLEHLGQHGADGESTDCAHPETLVVPTPRGAVPRQHLTERSRRSSSPAPAPPHDDCRCWPIG